MLELRLKCSVNNTNNIQEGFMIRHLVFTALFATASFANAGTVEASSATVQPAWSFNSGLGGSGQMSASQSMIAYPGMAIAHNRMGDVAPSSVMLFAQTGPAGSSPVLLSGTSATSADAPASAEVVATVGATPAATEMPAIVVNADVIVSADAIAPAAVPEPTTGMLMLAGLLGAGFLRRRRN